jgi:hypothetical protein
MSGPCQGTPAGLGKQILSVSPLSQPIGTAVAKRPKSHKLRGGRLHCGQSGGTTWYPQISLFQANSKAWIWGNK